MIIETKKEINIQKDGVELEHVQMSIDQDSIDILMDFLSSGIYKDGIGSVIREQSSNSIDSSIKAGNNSPVLVSLKNNNGQWQFIVEDTGVGLSKDDVKNIISKYLCSTKRSDDKQLGQKGVGFKSGLAYKDYFQFQCRKDGKEVLCMMRKGDPLPEIDFLYEKDTDEPNGVKVIVDVDYSDRREFSNKMRTQLIYFDNVYIQDDYSAFDNTYKIYKNDLFSYSKICSDKTMHLNFAGVYYPLDFDKLGINRIDVPIAINISLTDGIEPTLSREDIRYTIHAKEFIKNKINLIADWFITEYNKTEIEYDSFIKAKSQILNPEYTVELGEESINFKDLISFSKEEVKNISVKGYNNIHLKNLAKRINHVVQRHKQVAELNYSNTLSTKSLYRDLYDSYKSNKYIINSVPVGNLKEYIKETCKNNSDFFKLDNTPIKLWFKSDSGIILQDTVSQKYSWYFLLNLADIPKKDWRLVIQDAQKAHQEYIDSAIDLRNLEIPKEWFEERKQQRKYEGKLLDKQQGEITYYFTREKEYGGQMFDKKTIKISELGKEKCMVVYFTPQEKEFALKMWDNIFYDCTLKKNFKIKFVLINSREQKHVQHLQNYKNWKEFMETNKFKKLVTKFKAQRETNVYQSILHSAEFSTILETLKKDKQEVFKRVSSYIDEVPGSISAYVLDDMLNICEEQNLWDYSIMSDIKEIEKLAKEFEFLQVLKVPNRWGDEENKTKFAKYVAQFILFNKLYKNDFEQFEICVKEPIEETITINEGELYAL